MSEQESAEVNFDDEFIIGPEEEEEDVKIFTIKSYRLIILNKLISSI